MYKYGYISRNRTTLHPAIQPNRKNNKQNRPRKSRYTSVGGWVKIRGVHPATGFSLGSSGDRRECFVGSHWWNQFGMLWGRAMGPCCIQGHPLLPIASDLYHQRTPKQGFCCWRGFGSLESRLGGGSRDETRGSGDRWEWTIFRGPAHFQKQKCVIRDASEVCLYIILERKNYSNFYAHERYTKSKRGFMTPP